MDIVTACWVIDRFERPTATEVLDIFDEQYVKDVVEYRVESHFAPVDLPKPVQAQLPTFNSVSPSFEKPKQKYPGKNPKRGIPDEKPEGKRMMISIDYVPPIKKSQKLAERPMIYRNQNFLTSGLGSMKRLEPSGDTEKDREERKDRCSRDAM